MELNYIRIPLYNLYYIDDLTNTKEIKLFNLEYILENYEKEAIEGIFLQLDWCVKNPEFNFTSLLPNLRFDDKEVYKYLVKLHSFFIDNKDALKL